MKKLSEGEVKKIVKNFKDNEVMEQFGNHRDFLLGGLDGKEEWKSRIAFADTYCEELAEIHQKFMEEYQIKPGENEFAYLKDANFRAGAGKERSRIIDMMKDYMAYRFYTDRKDDPNRIKTEHIDEIYGADNTVDTDAEKEYRKLLIPDDEMDFIIGNSAYTDEKKAGIRECRKWMYRNCSKAGAFKMAGTKRNYIDSFGKMPVQQQVNALYQVESRYYKYEDKEGIGEMKAASDEYVPNLANFKSRMLRSKWNVPSRPTGDHTFWSRLERAVDKTVERKDQINKQYEIYKATDKNNIVNLEDRESSVNQRQFQKNAKATVDEFEKLRQEYHKALRKYLGARKKKNEDALKRKGLEIQNLWKDKNKQKILKQVEGDTKAISEFVDLTKKFEKVGKMTDTEIKRITPERVISKIDEINGYKNLAATAWGIGTGAAGLFVDELPSGVNFVSKSFTALGVVTNAYTAIKSFAMSAVSLRRRQKAAKIKETLKDDYKSMGKGEEKLEKSNRKANVLAKVSKRSNRGKTRTYFTTALLATAAVGFGIATLAVATAAMPVTIAGTVVSIGGGIANALYSSRRNSKLLKKAADSAAKFDEEFETVTDKQGNKIKRYIEVKADERKKELEGKRNRFEEGSKSYDILDTYIKKPKNIKARIRTNYAVKKGGSTLGSFKLRLDKELAEEAFRNIFLKDPDGPITQENLIPKEEFKTYVSTKAADREGDVIKNSLGREQTLHEARLRVEYKELLEAEGVKIKVPENVAEAKRMFHEKNKEVKNNENKNKDIVKDGPNK